MKFSPEDHLDMSRKRAAVGGPEGEPSVKMQEGDARTMGVTRLGVALARG